MIERLNFLTPYECIGVGSSSQEIQRAPEIILNLKSETLKRRIRNSAIKWLIAINRIQNKSFCLHNVCTVFIYYVYINTHIHVYI